ncbi:MAG TPA: GNAT family N-acetyltransferase [Saprospiraceae bacterium]|nr:GNAT family N-acetyltransferase [Saprospiraceae bacterium]
MQAQFSYLEDIIDESVEMQPLEPVVFDTYMAEGWRLLGHSIVRHNFSVCRGKMCRTIPLRIRLDGFQFSKSQRRVLRRADDLVVQFGPIVLNSDKAQLFTQHAFARFEERRPESIASFLNHNSHSEPVTGMEFAISDRQGTPLACSFIHIGAEVVSGTYCFFNPEIRRHSLGTLTMLLEIAKAQELGKNYYYHGYIYDVPSQFDYKLNFNNLESLDWQTGTWQPHQRVAVRRWADLVEVENGQNV